MTDNLWVTFLIHSLCLWAGFNPEPYYEFLRFLGQAFQKQLKSLEIKSYSSI